MRSTESERSGLIAEWRRSGSSVAEFCRVRGLARSTFDLWRRRALRRSESGGFVELQVTAKPLGPDDSHATSVRTPDGYVVRLGGRPTADAIVGLIARLRCRP